MSQKWQGRIMIIGSACFIGVIILATARSLNDVLLIVGGIVGGITLVLATMMMFFKWDETNIEAGQYTRLQEEARAVANAGETDADILLVGFEYCKVIHWKSDPKPEVRYFAPDGTGGVARREEAKLPSVKDGWTHIVYWNDAEVTEALYYRNVKQRAN